VRKKLRIYKSGDRSSMPLLKGDDLRQPGTAAQALSSRAAELKQ